MLIGNKSIDFAIHLYSIVFILTNDHLVILLIDLFIYLIVYFIQSTSNINRDLMLTATNSKQMSALEVFKEALNFLKEHFLENVNNRNAANNITVDKVRWVLTVPAIWNDAAKQLMRKSAEKVKRFLFNLFLNPQTTNVKYLSSIGPSRDSEFLKF